MVKWIKRCFAVALAVGTLGALGVLWANHKLAQPLNIASSDYMLMIESGTGFSEMSARLEVEGLIGFPPIVLNLYARLSETEGAIQSGEYLLHSGLNSYDLVDLLTRGDVVRYRATLIEGWTFAEVLNYLSNHPNLEQHYDPQKTVWSQIGVESPLNAHPEGLFFPDTYSFVRGATDVGILSRAYQQMVQVVETEWARRAEGLPYETPYDALIMASIVEKETGQPHERDRIAGVFVTRLQKNMRLQTDPTVIYGLPQDERRNIRSRHLKDATNPYNTYRHSGLPPTPIAMPGQAAIHAALNPLQDGALFFVAKGDGSHQFSETLDQHRQAVRDYQLKRREDYRSAPQ
ncbi:endolytic transglycosylase MltG [Litorivivens sp.]|uniref:endolytic transglycosylase MltG n=2 Tax=Litorivivens sp. TaxID=2020868 RepID=UPI003569548D